MMRLLRIAGREYVAYVKTVGFWLSMLMMPVIGAISIGAPTYLERTAPPAVVAVMDRTASHYDEAVYKSLAKPEKDKTVVQIARPPAGSIADPATIRRWMAQGFGDGGPALTAVAVISGAGDAVTLDFWSNNLADRSLEHEVSAALGAEMQARRLAALGVDQSALAAAQTLKPKVASFSPKAAAGGKVALRDRLPGIVGFGAAMLLWMMIFTGAGILLNSVIEEKSNRVLEVLLASASVPEIMFGKILGVAGVTLTVLAVWAGVGGTLLVLTQPAIAADVASVLMARGWCSTSCFTWSVAI